MDIKDRLKIARDIQDKCLIHKIECDVKTNFYDIESENDNTRKYHNMYPYVYIWVFPKNKREDCFSLYFWNDDENIKELDKYKYFMDTLEKLIKECD